MNSTDLNLGAVARIAGLLLCGLLIGLAPAIPAAAESISFDQCQAKGEWFVWRSAHRPLGVAWKNPYRLKLDPRIGDYEQNTTAVVVDDARLTKVAVMQRTTELDEITESMKERLAPPGARIEDVKFGGLDFQGIAPPTAANGQPAEHVLLRIDDGQLTLVSLTAIRKPREPFQKLLDRVGQQVRVSLKESPAPGDRRGDEGVAPREGDWVAAEEVARGFVLALLTQDRARAEELMLDHPEAGVLFGGPGPPAEAIAMMKQLVPQAPIHRCEVGEELELPGGGRLTLTDADVNQQELQLMPEIGGEPMNPPLSVVNQNGTWKVDPRPLIAARKAAAGR